MNNIVYLSDYKKNLEFNKENEILDALYLELSEIINNLCEQEPIDSPYNEEHNDFWCDVLSYNGIKSIPNTSSESALLNAYYSLTAENRNDLADLVLEILKMKQKT